jgi:RNA polymerase sigma-70 factor (ECF subfamily)
MGMKHSVDPRPPGPAASGDDSEADLVRRIAGGDRRAFEQLMRQHNGSLFRAARAIVRDDADAEDVLQEAYLAAYRHLADFRGRSKLSTWLTRIVINQALGRLRSRRRDSVVVHLDDRDDDGADPLERAMATTEGESAEASAMRSQMRDLLERKIDALPLAFRTTFILREVEEMTIEEVAECLSVPEATVRTRVFRARALLRASLAEEIDVATAEVFAFAGGRCDRIVAAVLGRLGEGKAEASV